MVIQLLLVCFCVWTRHEFQHLGLCHGHLLVLLLVFPGRSAGKESTWNAGDPSSIPGLGRSPGEGIGYPLRYFWASLVAQLVKNPPAMQETWV